MNLYRIFIYVQLQEHILYTRRLCVCVCAGVKSRSLCLSLPSVMGAACSWTFRASCMNHGHHVSSFWMCVKL